MYQAVFIAYLTQGLLLGLVVLALLAAVPKLQKRYGPRWLCRLWVTLAVLFLVPVRALVPQAPAAVSVSAAPLYTPVTVLQEETTQKPAGNVPYRTTTAADNTTHYIVPRTEIQTGRRTILERLAINTTRGNLAALVWELGILAVAVYQFGGYAVWRIRVGRNAQPVAKSWRDALPQGQCPQMQATPLVRSPMVAGALHPVLLVPAGEAPKGADCMLAHELTHIKRHDVAKKLLLTLVCILLCQALHTSASHAIIGALMVLTPGVALTMGVRDILNGDYLSGSIRLLDALLIAGSIAGGVVLGWIVARGLGVA